MKNEMYFSKNLIDSRYSNKLTSSMQRYVGSVNVEKRRRKRKSDEVHGAETQRRGIRNAEPRSRSPGILSRVLSLMDETGLTLLAGIRRCPCSCIINNSLSLSLSLWLAYRSLLLTATEDYDRDTTSRILSSRENVSVGCLMRPRAMRDPYTIVVDRRCNFR